MASKKFERILGKYFVNQASLEELDDLELWIKNPDNEKEFINYIKVNYSIDYNLKTSDTNKTKNLISKLIKEEKRHSKIRRIQNYVKYAAVFVGILISVYFFKDSISNWGSESNTPTIVNTVNEPGTDKATLTLEDGSQVALEKGDSYQTQNVKSNGEEIVYEAGEENSAEIAYNYLTIPRGGQFHVVLSDGTKVWLNSESKLKYPVRFSKGETRNVELLYGEAYFNVSSSSNNGGAKFKVFNQFQKVEVIGTEFNIKAYKDETHIYTTLVEGEVAVTSGFSKQNLVPNEQLNLDITNSATEVLVVDVKGEIAWIHGDFIFQHKPLEEIMKVLSRWYDVEIEFQNESLKDIKFIGELSKYQKLEDILLLIKNTNNITNYEINDKKITLK